MKTTQKYCDFCGITIEATSGNGWKGSLSLKRDGNFFIPKEFEEKTVDACFECGNKITSYCQSLRKEFTRKTVVEVKE